MAHIKIAVFMESEECTDKQLQAVFERLQLHFDFFVTQWSTADHKSYIDADAFITADGKLIDLNQLLWMDGASENICKSTYKALLKGYYTKACRERLHILIADCHM